MATTPRTQPTTATVSRATLMDVLALGIQAHPELSVRMDKAAEIVASGGVERGQVAGWWVRSQARDTVYFVTLVHDYRFDQCSCPHSQQRGGPCKHAIAVRMLLACQRREARLRRAMERHVQPAPACGPQGADGWVLTRLGEAYLQGQDAADGDRPGARVPWRPACSPRTRRAIRTGSRPAPRRGRREMLPPPSPP